MVSSNKHIKDVMQYCKDIKSGKILSGLHCKKAINRFLSDLKRQGDEDFLYFFDELAAVDVMEFAEKLHIPDIGKKLELLPWMKFIYANLFGWKHKLDPERRRFRSSYVEVARKNSKTTSLLFPMILFDFKRTKAAESFFVSRTGEQSAKTYQELKQIYLESFQVNPYDTVITDSGIKNKDNSFIQFFSSETRGTDSYKNSMSVVDEFHAYDNDKVITSFRYGGRARKNNLVLIITSAGTNIAGACFAENEKARKVLNGMMTDESYFTIIYAYDDGDDWKDNKNFIKANPSLSAIVTQDILEQDLQDALITPSHQQDFKAKTCGIWSNDTSNWIPLVKWDTKVRNHIMGEELFENQNCCAGLDLSSINDFTAYTKCFERDGLFYLFHKFYIPSEQVKEKYRVENINIAEWVQRGIVTATPGATVDYDFIKADIVKDNERFNITELAYDKWQANKLIESLDELIPKTLLVQFDQSLKSMAAPTKDFERLIYDDKIIDPNPVAKWMISNAVIKADVNNNYKPLKEYKSSTKRIDSVITSIMSVSRCIANKGSKPTNTNFDDVLKLF